MNITKKQLQRIIREEAASVVAEQAQSGQGKVAGDVGAVSSALDKVSSLKKLLGRINNRAEFQQLLSTLVQMAAVNVESTDVIAALKVVLANQSKTPAA